METNIIIFPQFLSKRVKKTFVFFIFRLVAFEVIQDTFYPWRKSFKFTIRLKLIENYRHFCFNTWVFDNEIRDHSCYLFNSIKFITNNPLRDYNYEFNALTGSQSLAYTIWVWYINFRTCCIIESRRITQVELLVRSIWKHNFWNFSWKHISSSWSALRRSS